LIVKRLYIKKNSEWNGEWSKSKEKKEERRNFYGHGRLLASSTLSQVADHRPMSVKPPFQAATGRRVTLTSI
jgi:hypothetical protein